jgi:penicillin-binding protein 1C
MTRLRALRGEPPSSLDAEFILEPTQITQLAQHYTRRALLRQPQALRVQGSIDSWQQTVMQRTLEDFIQQRRSQGLRNGAAVLMHVPTREIRGYVGSADFFQANIQGQVDGVIARRSPGSALKPFIYALALDAGVIQPHTLVDDAPKRFADFNPENSDGAFLGPIPAHEALRRSRNVPFIDLANRLPGGGLEVFLRSKGILRAQSAGRYGLALALGGAEISLEQLAGLYADLSAAAHGDTRGNISPAAAWLTLQALREPESAAPHGLSWKTGTSHGFRDNWACGIVGEWVLGVWLGNFDGKALPGLMARDTAAPLLWQLTSRLGLAEAPQMAKRPSSISETQVCSLSGDLLGLHCPHAAPGHVIAGISPMTTCRVHRQFWVNDAGQRVTEADSGAQTSIYEVWSAHRLEQFRQAGLPRSALPPLAPSDAADTQPDLLSLDGPAPRILSPQAKLDYLLRPSDPSKNSISLEADAAPGVRQVHWFAGNRYLGASAPAQALQWRPEAGKWALQALDDAGRASHVEITVRAVP